VTDGVPETEYQLAANGYLVWPLALATLMRPDAAASRWARIHARQAVIFGIAITLGYVVLLALPLLAVVADPGISTGTTVLVYAVGLAADLAVFVFLAIRCFRYYARTARGELFTIPVAGAIADRVFGPS
jgi:uncharacterized membrane protein